MVKTAIAQRKTVSAKGLAVRGRNAVLQRSRSLNVRERAGIGYRYLE
jgi:hypothetical protein